MNRITENKIPMNLCRFVRYTRKQGKKTEFKCNVVLFRYDGEFWTHNRPKIILLIAKGCVPKEQRKRKSEKEPKHPSETENSEMAEHAIKQKMTTKSMAVLETEIKTNESKLSQNWDRNSKLSSFGFMLLMLLAIVSISNGIYMYNMCGTVQNDTAQLSRGPHSMRKKHKRLTIRWELKY